MAQYFTQEGLDKLKKELEERRGPVRAEIGRRILAAKQLGDLSENAEYTEAREEQAFNEGRIAELEEAVREAVIVEPHKKHDVASVGSTIRVKSLNGEKSFTIVGPTESNPSNGFISNESPLGQAFLGRKKGDEVEVKIPSGIVKYKILEVA